MKKTIIVVITPTSSQPRFHKRISALLKISNVVVFSFSRGLYEVNNFRSDIQLHSLGEIKNERYFSRIIPFIKAISIVKNNIPKDYNNIQFYSFSVDCLFIARLSGLKKGFLEVGDLMLKNTSNKLFKIFERFILKLIKGLVLTSPEYYNQYYKYIDVNKKTPIYIIENKISKRLLPLRVTSKIDMISNDRPIIIGMIGFIRYETPIVRLIRFVEKYSNFTMLKIFGDGPYKKLIQDHESNSIQFYGSFNNPGELKQVYKEVDLSYVVYDIGNLNERLAIPNKLYESAFFQVPIICSTNTYLSQIVEAWDIGGAVRIDSQKHFDTDMSKLVDRTWINQKTQNCINVPNSVLINQQENVLKNLF